MLTINGLRRITCEGITRRALMQIGGAGLLGLSLPKILAAQSVEESLTLGKAKSVIFLYLFDGPSQLETFDMKPGAPQEVRGPFVPIRSRTPGLLMCEHLSRLAKISHKYAVIRTMTHDFNDHSGGAHYIQTGRRWYLPIGGGFLATPQDWPSMGSVVHYLCGKTRSGGGAEIPPYAVVPNWFGRLQESGQYRRPGHYGGWLGASYNPITTVVPAPEARRGRGHVARKKTRRLPLRHFLRPGRGEPNEKLSTGFASAALPPPRRSTRGYNPWPLRGRKA
jgi:hypothetical protein